MNRPYPVAVRRLMVRLRKGGGGILAYDHGHGSYVFYAQQWPSDEGVDVIGRYCFPATIYDVLADIQAFEAEPLRKASRGRVCK